MSARRTTRSCAECRRRKARCTWADASNPARIITQSACDRCVARGLNCLPQLGHSVPRGDVRIRKTEEDRISELERKLASLTEHLPDVSSITQRTTPTRSGPHASVDLSREQGEVENVAPPHHLRLLFENEIADDMSTSSVDVDEKLSNQATLPYMMSARQRMQALIPSKAEVDCLADVSSGWMSLYHSLFPAFFTFRTGQHLIANRDGMRSEHVHPVLLAMYLLSLAISVQQLPQDSPAVASFHGVGSISFVGSICCVVDETIVQNDHSLGTVQGIETAMLLIRLSLGRGALKKTWMMLRRVIAVAEMMNLPKAAHALTQRSPHFENEATGVESSKRKLAVWEAICATDRNLSMMMNLAPGTIRYDFPLSKSVFEQTKVSAQAYNYQLSAVCALVFEIDELYAQGVSITMSYEKVLGADSKLRELSALVPQQWWQLSDESALVDRLVQFWHHYITARVHLRPAMEDARSGGRYRYSMTTCLDACRRSIDIFVTLRRSVPSGFFVCRILDVQAFTMAAFLLMSNESNDVYSEASALISDDQRSIQTLIDCFQTVIGQSGSDLAEQAVKTLQTLQSYSMSDTDDQSREALLDIPLLGRITLQRRGKQSVAPSTLINAIHRDDMQEERGATALDRHAEVDNFPGWTNNFPNGRMSNSLSSWDMQLTNAPFWTDTSFSEQDHPVVNQESLEHFSSWL